MNAIDLYKCRDYFVSEINECESSPCVQGTCVEAIDSYTCDCHDGWEGGACDIGKWYHYMTYILHRHATR